MKIVHTYWTQNKTEEAINNKGGWLSNEAHYMSWALSCLNAKKLYNRIELYTDKEGYNLFIEKLKIPYDNVHVVFSNDFSERVHPKLWALSKMHTYGMQEEPFIHIDGDFILWEKIDFDTNLIFQNIEVNFDLYKDAFRKLKNKKIAKNDYIDNDFVNKSFNMGVFGCKDVAFSKQYSKEIFDVLNSFDYNSIDDLSYINILLEQNYVHYLCQKLNTSFKTIHPDVETDFNSNHKNIFFNIPSKDFPFNPNYALE